MADKNNIWGQIAIWAIIALVIGGFAGAWLFSTHTIEKVPEIKYVDKEVIKEVSVEVPVEIIRGLEFYKEQAILAFMAEVEDDKDFRYCDDEKYSMNEITLKDTSDDFTITAGDDGEYKVTFEAKLKYKDEDTCYNWYDVEVDFDGNDVEVNAELQ